MSDVLQHILALTLVAACVGYVGWQAVRTLSGKRSRVGSCCTKGCDPERQQGGTTPASGGPKIVYIPVSMLGRGSKR